MDQKTPDHTAYPPPPPPEGAKRSDDLAPEHAEKQKEVQAHFESADYKIPGLEKGELMDEEKFWLSYECTLRYLRATKWHVKQAIERLQDTLKWRRDFGLYDWGAADVEPEAVTGKEITFGYDLKRRPALYMIPSRQNTEESPRQIRFAVWMLERSLDLAGPGVESIVLMINFADRGKSPSMSTSKTVLNILQSHYPERLGAALILNVPWLLNAFFKLITPFIDPVTREKMKFNPNAVEDGLFSADSLFSDSGWGGSRDFVWDHDKYWPGLVRMCAEIREKHMERWRKLGARVGLSEWDYKMEEKEKEPVEDESPGEKVVDSVVVEEVPAEAAVVSAEVEAVA
ncbi:CRAL/TRIO domain-containing protein [Artomyces pyxidatus]|uniref:CRAL/TRIO domain-containing protein n=1 Tax=Artomyces pyxidatus TaxID=48021 RepID=A0ACB8SQC6_9AGAM|nr:CRAL/TRIO domain-containing protein [Artomyces pyxidatus]